jgi:hypothetical protein
MSQSADEPSAGKMPRQLAGPLTAIFAIGCGLAVIGILWRQLPERHPISVASYTAILASMRDLVLHTPFLRQRALHQGFLFAAFNVFWTGSPLLLLQRYGMTLGGVALFSLIGAGGALAAPLAGCLADRELIKPATRLSMWVALSALLVAGWANHVGSIFILAIAGLSLDAAVQVCLVFSLRGIYMLEPENRSRLNGLFMASVFGCGAVASAVAASIYTLKGWVALMAFGAVPVAVGLALNLLENEA